MLTERPAAHYERFSKRKHTDSFRSPAEKDVDRILYCSAFNRLSYVTQVFDPTHGARYHNRLTHSLKVAQLSRRICSKLLAEDDGKAGDICLDPHVAEAAALAHDLGHPPFGHIGEHVLDKFVHEQGVDSGFEGNAQTFRIVTQLARLDTGYSGLDLTAATLCAIMKYPWGRDKNVPAGGYTKFGYYESEEKVARFAKEKLGLHGKERSLEAEVMDIADDIAYSVYDLHDFYKSGHIPVNEIFSVPEDYGKKVKLTAQARMFFESYKGNDKRALRTAFGRLCTNTRLGYLQRFAESEAHRAEARHCASELIERFVKAIRLSKGKLCVASEVKHEIKLLKKLTWQYVINSRYLQIYQEGHKCVLGGLLSLYSSKMKEHVWTFFPADLVQEKLFDAGPGVRARVIADLLATMTEKDVIETHKRISGTMLDGVSVVG